MRENVDSKTREYLDVKFELVSQQQNAILGKVDKIEQDFKKIEGLTISHEKELGVLESMVKGLEHRFDKHEKGESELGKETNKRINDLERFVDAQKRDNHYIEKSDAQLENKLDKTGDNVNKTEMTLVKMTAYISGAVAAAGFMWLFVKWVISNWSSIIKGVSL